MSRNGSRRFVGSATSSSSRPELAAALHRLRSTLARARAELELARPDGDSVLIERLLGDLSEALDVLGLVEAAAFSIVSVLVVDDDERLAELTARGLRRMGYVAESAARLRALRPREVVVFDLGVLSSLNPAERRPQSRATGRADRRDGPRFTRARGRDWGERLPRQASRHGRAGGGDQSPRIRAALSPRWGEGWRVVTTSRHY